MDPPLLAVFLASKVSPSCRAVPMSRSGTSRWERRGQTHWPSIGLSVVIWYVLDNIERMWGTTSYAFAVTYSSERFRNLLNQARTSLGMVNIVPGTVGIRFPT